MALGLRGYHVIRRRSTRLRHEVRDTLWRRPGIGFDSSGSFPGHLGLESMRERAERLGGTLEVESRPGNGTRILVRVPSK